MNHDAGIDSSTDGKLAGLDNYPPETRSNETRYTLACGIVLVHFGCLVREKCRSVLAPDPKTEDYSGYRVLSRKPGAQKVQIVLAGGK